MYLKCILHALLHSMKRIHVSWHFACVLHVSHRSPRYIWDTHQIHQDTCDVSYALPWCHTGYISGYIRIHVSWTLHHDTSRYIRIQNYVHVYTCTSGIHSGYMMWYMCLKCIQRGMCLKFKIHAGYMWDTCILYVSWEAIKIHVEKIHAGYIIDDEIHVGIPISNASRERWCISLVSWMYLVCHVS